MRDLTTTLKEETKEMQVLLEKSRALRFEIYFNGELNSSHSSAYSAAYSWAQLKRQFPLALLACVLINK